MSSDLQQIASRANGAKSGGPVTEEGRQASSQNSRTHGLLSKKVVLAGESQDEFDALLASFLHEHQPETATERDLIERMAIARWRQERVWNCETAGLNNEIRRPRYHEGEDYATFTFVAFRTMSDDSRVLDLLNRYEARFERQFRAALSTFLNLRTKRHAEERADADAGIKRVQLYWIDEEGNRTLQADTHPDPEPDPEPEAAPGSFGSPVSPAEEPPFPKPFASLQALYRRLSAFVQAPFIQTAPTAPAAHLETSRVSLSFDTPAHSLPADCGHHSRLFPVLRMALAAHVFRQR
jgi:hypothetical protein